jgi:hypothetical protein
LAEKLGRGRAKQEKLSRLFPDAASLVHEASEERKNIGKPLNLIQDDEVIHKSSQIEFRICQLREIGQALEIEVMDGLSQLQIAGKRGFADLAGAEQGHHRIAGNPLDQLFLNLETDHLPCISGIDSENTRQRCQF